MSLKRSISQRSTRLHPSASIASPSTRSRVTRPSPIKVSRGGLADPSWIDGDGLSPDPLALEPKSSTSRPNDRADDSEAARVHVSKGRRAGRSVTEREDGGEAGPSRSSVRRRPSARRSTRYSISGSQGDGVSRGTDGAIGEREGKQVASRGGLDGERITLTVPPRKTPTTRHSTRKSISTLRGHAGSSRFSPTNDATSAFIEGSRHDMTIPRALSGVDETAVGEQDVKGGEGGEVGPSLVTPRRRSSTRHSIRNSVSAPQSAAETSHAPERAPAVPPVQEHSTSQVQFAPNAYKRPIQAVAPVQLSSSRKGKGRETLVQPEKRVLPARIRRAAGGGAEGIRDLEEMIVDWLERWGVPCTSPPDDLPLYLTTLPLSLVHPPTQQSHSAQPAVPAVTVTPTRSKQFIAPSPSPRRGAIVLETEERIETPDWVMVKPGEDDEEEAKEELGVRGPSLSPVKRLRRMTGDDTFEDTSDAYYIFLHRRYEVFERRQRIREKEKLNFERYKMRSRIDLLRNLSPPAWSAVVSAILSRTPDPADIWTKGREKLKTEGVDWLRRRLVKEGKELLAKYDQLLPVESKKPKGERTVSTPTPTPERAMSETSGSLSPPPVLPARVVALRESNAVPKRRVSNPGPKAREAEREEKERRSTKGEKEVPKTPKRKRETEPSSDQETKTRRRSSRHGGVEVVKTVQADAASSPLTDDPGIEMDLGSRTTSPLTPLIPSQPRPAQYSVSPKALVQRRSSRRSTGADNHNRMVEDDGLAPFHMTGVAEASPSPKSTFPASSSQIPSSAGLAKTSPSPESSSPPLTVTGIPCLIEAASRRESAIAETLVAHEKVQAVIAGKRGSRYVAREKTRTSGRLGTVQPFGVPLPNAVEYKSEFTITDEEDFWGIIADREQRATQRRRDSLVTIPTKTSHTLSKEEAEMREVEAAVVL